MKLCSIGFIAIVLSGFANCATTGVSPTATLAADVSKADNAYRNLPASLSTYNSAVREICNVMQAGTPRNSRPALK
jgi:hypothetical protein